MFLSTPFEEVWGRYYVREYPAGRYEFKGWEYLSLWAYGSTTVKPKVPPAPLAFEVQAGTVTYLGNIHAKLILAKNLVGVPTVAGLLPEIRDEFDRDLALILKEYPQLLDKVENRSLATGLWGMSE